MAIIYWLMCLVWATLDQQRLQVHCVTSFGIRLMVYIRQERGGANNGHLFNGPQSFTMLFTLSVFPVLAFFHTLLIGNV